MSVNIVEPREDLASSKNYMDNNVIIFFLPDDYIGFCLTPSIINIVVVITVQSSKMRTSHTKVCMKLTNMKYYGTLFHEYVLVGHRMLL